MKSKKTHVRKFCTVREAEHYFLINKKSNARIGETNPKILGALLAKKTLKAVKLA